MASKDYGFEPNGLTGWRVFLERDKLGSRWVFSTPSNFPRTFDWSDDAKDHVIPVCDDWRGPFNGQECKEARQAVAAAHAHRRAVLAHCEAKGLAIHHV